MRRFARRYKAGLMPRERGQVNRGRALFNLLCKVGDKPLGVAFDGEILSLTGRSKNECGLRPRDR